MAIPFKVFDPDYSDYLPRRVWCVRCEDWIPTKEAYGAGYDPHVSDHIMAWTMLQQIDLPKRLNSLTIK